jgi:hypothetical protein
MMDKVRQEEIEKIETIMEAIIPKPEDIILYED